MRFIIGAIALCLVACTSSESKKVSFNKFQDQTIRNIYSLGNERKFSEVIKYTKSTEAQIRAEAVRQFAHCQDSAYLAPLHLLLFDSIPEVQSAAAFALGQIGSTQSYPYLIAAFQFGTDSLLRGECLVALGKTLPSRNQINLYAVKPFPFSNEKNKKLTDSASFIRNPYNFLANVPLQSTFEEECWGNMFRELNRRKQFDREIMVQAKYLLHQSGVEGKRAIARAMTAAPSEWHVENDEYFLQWANMERDSETRAYLMKNLAACQNEKANQLIHGYATGASQTRQVRFQALRSLTLLTEIKGDLLLSNLSDADVAIVTETMDLLEDQLKPTWLDEYESQLAQHTSAEVRARYHRWKIMLKKNGAAEEMFNTFLGQKDLYAAMAFVQCMNKAPELFSRLVDEVLAKKTEPALQYATAEMLLQEWKTYDGDFENDLLIAGLKSGDTGLRALVGDFVADASHPVRNAQALADAVQEAHATLQLPREVETRQALDKALARLGKAPKEEAKLTYKELNWEKIQTIPVDQTIRIKTTQGDIEVVLQVEQAPATVAYILELIENGFYTDKAFHRVVPDFVIQAGCPRGDGMGSTDELIRSEFQGHQFSRGSIGMASAGVDTESCQWFITQSDVPHLNGRYTQFGKVTVGMDVVDRIQRGDRIIAVEVL